MQSVWLLILAILGTAALAQDATTVLPESDPPLAPLEISRPGPLFGQEEDADSAEGPQFAVKPGHWSLTRQQMRANLRDFVGQLSIELRDEVDRPVPLAHLQFGLRTSRPVALAKGQTKQVTGHLLLPLESPGKRLRVQLAESESAAEVFRGQAQLARVPAYQYDLVVLSPRPERFAFLKATPAVRAPWEAEFAEPLGPHYRVALVNSDQDLPLPENPLQWTTIASLWWDGVEPDGLSGEQQRALVDWLHWGGRLVVNGPASLATLRGSFLDHYLPALDDGTRRLSASRLESWSNGWNKRDQGQLLPPVKTRRSLSALVLTPRAQAVELPGGEQLFWEIPVGRGSVVVSAVSLAEPELLNWPGYEGFLNSGLLRRPGRVFSLGPYDGLCVAWADYPQQRYDAHFTTGLRLWTRDARVAANTLAAPPVPGSTAGASWAEPTLQVDRAGGIAAWDDFSPVAQAARAALLAAAGVRVPGRAFVLSCLVLYLVLLVPLNWLVFRTLGHVEWAWFSVPLIALAGTWGVVHQAQLDIGFVRAQTEVAVLELQGNHPRGLLTRYGALYSSLSTTYEIRFPEQPTALVLPFPASDQDETEWLQAVEFHSGASPRLTGLAIASASTRLVHAEQMVDLAGPLRLGRSSRGQQQVENRTQWHFRNAAVVHRTFNRQGQPRYEGCWLGEIRAGTSAILGMLPISFDGEAQPFAAERKLAAQGRRAAELDATALENLAFNCDDPQDPLAAQREEYRLVGILAETLPGMEVTPLASQRQGVTVLVAHLSFGPLPPPPTDVNSPQDVATSE